MREGGRRREGGGEKGRRRQSCTESLLYSYLQEGQKNAIVFLWTDVGQRRKKAFLEPFETLPKGSPMRAMTF